MQLVRKSISKFFAPTFSLFDVLMMIIVVKPIIEWLLKGWFGW